MKKQMQITNYNIQGEKMKTGQELHGFTLYHVYFNGLKRSGLDCNFLLTYDGKRAPGLDYLLEHDYKGKLFLDSGAYPAMRRNTDLDIDKYIDYVNQVHTHFSAVAQLDYLPRKSDGTAEESGKHSGEETWRRFVYMWYKVSPECRKKLIYVVHGSEEIAPLLERALQWRDNSGIAISYMGCGLSVSNKGQRGHHLGTIEKLCKQYNYQGSFHAFGLQVLDILQRSDYITSADSSSAIKDQMQGCVFVNGRPVKIADDSAAHHKSKFTSSQNDIIQESMKKRAAMLGINYELAKVDAQERYLWGLKERDNYFLSGYQNKQKLVRGGLLK